MLGGKSDHGPGWHHFQFKFGTSNKTQLRNNPHQNSAITMITWNYNTMSWCAWKFTH